MLITELVSGAERAPALVSSGGVELSYGALREAYRYGSEQVRVAGAGPGRVVGVEVADPSGLLLAALSVWEAGAAVLPLDARAPVPWREELAARAGIAATVSGAASDGSLTIEPRPAPRRVDPRVALLLFTSGSSGKPKGVLLSAEGIAANVRAILGYLPVREHPRTAVVLPLWYSYALVGQALTALSAGATLLLLSDLGFPAQQLQAMARSSASGLSSVPTSLRLLCRAAMETGLGARLQLGYVASAGGAMDAATAELIRSAFPAARRFNQYGLTEASPRVTALSELEAPFARGSVGRPLPGIEVWAEGPDGRRLGPGQEGALMVRGPSVMLGYLDDSESAPGRRSRARVGPQADESGFPVPPGEGQGEGGLHQGDSRSRAQPVAEGSPHPCPHPVGERILRTGDAGWVDEQGYVYVSGRIDGVVKCGGERVSVEEVASVLRTAAGVGEVQVVALPDELLGARLVAVAECPPERVSELRRIAREKLPPAKRPVKIVPVEALPRTPNGKVALEEVRKLADSTGHPAAR